MPFFSTDSTNNAPGTYEHLDVRPIAGSLGAEIHGVDVRRIDEATFAEIRRASAEHLVIFFDDQDLTVDDLETFTARWGEFGDDPFVEGMPDHPHVVRLVKEADERVGAVFGGAWHSDWSFQAAPPSHTILYAREVPAYGGDTLWANLHLAYEWFSPAFRSVLDTLTADHSPSLGYGPQASHNTLIEHMTIRWGPEGDIVRSQPLVRVHPATGRRALNVSPGYTAGITGMRAEESSALLELLFEVATNPTFTCRYRWRAGSLAVWDNCATLHLPLSDYLGQRRELWRTTVRGSEPRGVEA